MQDTLDTLNEIAGILREANTLEELEDAIVTEGVRLSDAKYGSIYLYRKRKLERVYTTLPKQLQVKIRNKGFTYKSFSSKQIIRVPITKVVRAHKNLDKLKVQSLILVPLVYKNKSIGVLSFDSLQNDITDEKIKALRLFATMATYSLNQIYHTDQMQTAIEIRDLFISVTAHEFRTPLTTINGYIQLIKRKISNEQRDHLHNWIHEMSDEVQRVIDLTNELLQISKIKTGKIEYSFEILNLMNVITTATKRFKFTFPEHTVRFENTLDNGVIVADYDKLLQAITNILENAGKFSVRDKQIDISLDRQQSWIIMKIRDYGRGIGKKDINKIFSGFYKAKNSEENSGMGLGLFIAKSIIESHKGKLTVESQLGKGTAFSIWLPEQRHGKISRT
ncbi:MAG: GAF domain-containing sensor histidine kinase [Patescibacteria group bacterium]